MSTMHSYNTRFQAQAKQAKQAKAQQERGVGLQSVLASPQEFQAQAKVLASPQEFLHECSKASHITYPSKRHRYDTRFEINRIRNAVILRDCAIMSNLFATAEAQQNISARVHACINIFTYLRWNRTLFSVKTFANTIYKKMDELKIECLNHIQGEGVQLRCFDTLFVLINHIMESA